MSHWNSFAARQEALENVPGHTTYYEATGGLTRLHTDVTPATAPKIQNVPALNTVLPIDPNEIPGVVFDEPVPRLIAIEEPVAIAEILTEEPDNFTESCVYFWSLWQAPTVYACSPIVHEIFSVLHTFSETEAGNYALGIRLCYSDAARHQSGRHFGWLGGVGWVRVATR